MNRPDLDTLACVNAECPLFCRAGAGNLVIRKVSGHDCLRLLRCRSCGEAFSERRGTALCNPKLPEPKAEEVINYLGEGCRVRATARLVKVAQETVARLVRVTGRHAARFHDQHVPGLTPRALACDEHWSCVKKSSSGARTMKQRGQGRYLGAHRGDGREHTGREPGGRKAYPGADPYPGPRCAAPSTCGAFPSDFHRCLRGVCVCHLGSLGPALSDPCPRTGASGQPPLAPRLGRWAGEKPLAEGASRADRRAGALWQGVAPARPVLPRV
jgi:transposase-like protein